MANYKMGVSWSVHIWQRMFKQKELELHFLTIDRMVQHWIESLPKKVQFQFEILISKKAFLIEEISERRSIDYLNKSLFGFHKLIQKTNPKLYIDSSNFFEEKISYFRKEIENCPTEKRMKRKN